MKKTLKSLALFAVIMAIVQIVANIAMSYRFEKGYLQYWNLADKSSTIAEKQLYIHEFVSALERGKEWGEFSTNNAILLKTADNSFESNLRALKTLEDRLTQIKGMNPNSFEYATSIQQITAQEQGEANGMLGVFHGCYVLNHCFLVWDWIRSLLIVVEIMILSGGLIYLLFSFFD